LPTGNNAVSIGKQPQYASCSTLQTPETRADALDPLYILQAVPVPGAGRQHHRCKIRRLDLLGKEPQDITVELGFGLRGFTTKVYTAAIGRSSLTLKFSDDKWKTCSGDIVATMTRAQRYRHLDRDAAIENIEFSHAVEADLRDLIVAAWCSSIWLRRTVPTLQELQNKRQGAERLVIGGRNEHFPTRDAFVKEQWAIEGKKRERERKGWEQKLVEDCTDE